jgi:hypothetical protein
MTGGGGRRARTRGGSSGQYGDKGRGASGLYGEEGGGGTHLGRDAAVCRPIIRFENLCTTASSDGATPPHGTANTPAPTFSMAGADLCGRVRPGEARGDKGA